MLQATTHGLYRTLFTAAALTGARSDELFAMRWSDIEMPDGQAPKIFGHFLDTLEVAPKANTA